MHDTPDIPGPEASRGRIPKTTAPHLEAVRLLLRSLPPDLQRQLAEEVAPRQVPEPKGEPDRWLTPAEAAQELHLCTRTLRRYALRGLLPARKTHGRAVRYRRSDLIRVFRA